MYHRWGAQGRQVIREACQRFWAVSSDSTITLFECAETGGSILYHFRDEGHHTGTLQTAKGSVEGLGAAFSLDGMSLITVGPDGLMASEQLYFDTLALFRQLGLG